MKLDKYYNLKDNEVSMYNDSFDEIVDLVADAKEKGHISNDEAKLILQIAFRRQNKQEIQEFFNALFNIADKKVKHTFFLHLKTNHTSYA